MNRVSNIKNLVNPNIARGQIRREGRRRGEEGQSGGERGKGGYTGNRQVPIGSTD